MRVNQQHSHSGLLSGKLGLAIVCVVALVLGAYFVVLPMLNKPVVSGSLPLEPEPKTKLAVETSSELDGQAVSQKIDTVEAAAPVVEPQAEFPLLTIDAKDEAAQLAQAKAAAEAAARFNEQKLNRLQAVLTEDASELESLAKVEISYLVNQWRDAWATGNTEAYLNFYSDNFVPSKKQGLDEWRVRRRNRVIPSKSAEIRLSNYDVSFNDELDTSEVEFDQHYKTTKYNDLARKKLVFVKEALGWKLISETVLKKDSSKSS